MSSTNAAAKLSNAGKRGVEKFTDMVENLNDSLWFKLLQIVLGVLLVYVIYLVALVAVKADSLGINSKLDLNKKQKVAIIDGYAESSQFSYENGVFNTSVPSAFDYLPVRPSVNLRGGAQFTYSLWLNLGSSDYARDIQNKCIFLKGDAQKYNYSVKTDLGNLSTNERISFCPMMCFGANEMEFSIYFNTFHNLRETFDVRKLESTNSAIRHNLMNLYSKKWLLITVVFEDNAPINDFENGILVKFYINDVLYQSASYASALRQNNGQLHMFPDGPVSNCKISNFAYYNYAVTDAEIKKVADEGPSNKPTEAVTKSFISQSWLSDYNRLDIYNT
jgi:hypothetical protein